MPANRADAMIRLLDGSANEGLATLSQILKRGQPTLGQLWTSQLSPQDTELFPLQNHPSVNQGTQNQKLAMSKDI